MTGLPALPESGGPNTHVLASRYVPSSRSTVTSALLVAASCDRTAPWAPDREHGAACEQAVPVPVGEAYSVTAVAADTCGTAVTISAVVNAATPVPAANRLCGHDI